MIGMFAPGYFNIETLITLGCGHHLLVNMKAAYDIAVKDDIGARRPRIGEKRRCEDEE